jgi:hypothetical protein
VSTRRQFIHGSLSGLAAFLAGLRSNRAGGSPLLPQPPPPGLPDLPVDPCCRLAIESRPFLTVPNQPPSIDIDGMPFADEWFGDWFPSDAIPFHHEENIFPGGEPPLPQEEVEIAIVGGGISGLASAFVLRQHRPVVFELHDRFGGAAQGEYWNGTHYSLGGAYIITPDPGTFLNRLYRQLNLHTAYRLSIGDDPMELNGSIRFDFWTGAGLSQDEVLAFQRYAQVVDVMAYQRYPDIPLPSGRDNQWILDLDRRTLKEDIEAQMGMPAPPLLAAGIQSYCYSSFGAGWEELSAAAGWNFIAAEEFGRWVFPGGNAYIVDRLWSRLKHVEEHQPPHQWRQMLRAGCRVVDVRLRDDGRLLVSWRDRQGAFRSLIARKVVMACPKHVAKHIIHDLAALDLAKLEAMHAVPYRAYVVANVLLEAPVALDFYDVFLLGDGVSYPTNGAEAESFSRVTDMLNGHFARPQSLPRSVLTLYWPLPFPTGRFRLIMPDAWMTYAQSIVPQIRGMLDLLKVPHAAVRQVRLTRWGHAMPVPYPGVIADGIAERLHRPIQESIFFIEQDNWQLPAVENCLLDLEIYQRRIEEGL